MGTEFGKGWMDVKNRGQGVAVVGCDGAVEVTTAEGYKGVEGAIMVVRIAEVEKGRFSPFWPFWRGELVRDLIGVEESVPRGWIISRSHGC